MGFSQCELLGTARGAAAVHEKARNEGRPRDRLWNERVKGGEWTVKTVAGDK